MGINFKFKNTTKKRITKLEKEFKPSGSPWGNTFFDELSETAKNVGKLHKEVFAEIDDALGRVEKRYDTQFNDMNARIKVLEEIVRESGLITDYSSDEVKIREDNQRDSNGHTWGRHNVAYQINQVKVL